MSAMAWAAEPVSRVQLDPASGAITFLSWDTEGGDRAARNLLREPSLPERGTLQASAQRGEIVISLPAKAALTLRFDPRVAATTLLPSRWEDDGSAILPAILNAPDFGPMLLRERTGRVVPLRLTGSRAEHRVDLGVSGPVELHLTPLLLAPPKGLRDTSLWPLARRGWLNCIQCCSEWGEQSRPFSSPPGILGNNVISDPASCSLWFYADQIFWMPEPAPGVSLLPMLRKTIEFWLDRRMRKDAAGRETGELTCYWDYGNFLDANAGPLIAAWDYVETSGDTEWLKSRITRLEMVADFLVGRDIDGDGLIEATQSGNYNTLQQPNRSCAWWDALNCGHKDGYTNAIIYRAFCCMADLEAKLGRSEQQRGYAARAAALKAAYFPTLFNEKTGWLAWWKSADGTLHDYASPTLNGLAIDYGLVPPDQAKQILDRLWAKMREVNFTRLDLGMPTTLIPVPRADYLQPDGLGIGKREDGSDTFGQYMNGGISAGHALHFINACYQAGQAERGDRLLRAMLDRQQRGEFQNGVTDSAMKGIDWTDWQGRPTGYEGYLAESFRFLQAILLREPEMRERLYRPMNQRP